MWMFHSLRFALTGEMPKESLLVLPPQAVQLGYTLDLVLLVLTKILAAVLFWRRASWGYVLATVTLLFGSVYQLNYMTAAHLPSQRERSWRNIVRPGRAIHCRRVRDRGGNHAHRDQVILASTCLAVWHDMARIRA
jgi:hypothetical protein